MTSVEQMEWRAYKMWTVAKWYYDKIFLFHYNVYDCGCPWYFVKLTWYTIVYWKVNITMIDYCSPYNLPHDTMVYHDKILTIIYSMIRVGHTMISGYTMILHGGFRLGLLNTEWTNVCCHGITDECLTWDDIMAGQSIANAQCCHCPTTTDIQCCLLIG